MTVHSPIIRRTFLLFDSPMQHEAKVSNNNWSSMMMMMMLLMKLSSYPEVSLSPLGWFWNVMCVTTMISINKKKKVHKPSSAATWSSTGDRTHFLKQPKPRPPAVTWQGSRDRRRRRHREPSRFISGVKNILRKWFQRKEQVYDRKNEQKKPQLKITGNSVREEDTRLGKSFCSIQLLFCPMWFFSFALYLHLFCSVCSSHAAVLFRLLMFYHFVSATFYCSVNLGRTLLPSQHKHIIGHKGR